MRNSVVCIPDEILGHPAGPQVQEAGEEIIPTIARDVTEACAKYQIGDDMIVPQRTHLFVATAT